MKRHCSLQINFIPNFMPFYILSSIVKFIYCVFHLFLYLVLPLKLELFKISNFQLIVNFMWRICIPLCFYLFIPNCSFQLIIIRYVNSSRDEFNFTSLTVFQVCISMLKSLLFSKIYEGIANKTPK